MIKFVIGPLMATTLLVCATPARASSISFVDTFRNDAYTQTGDGNSLTFQQSFFSAALNTTVSNPYTAATLVVPFFGTKPLSQTSATVYSFQTPGLPSQAVMDLLYPPGLYVMTGFNGSTTDTTSFSYTLDDYPSLPYLTGTDYSSLQGMNASQPFTFHFSPDVTGSNATDSFIFFTIFDFTKNAFVVTDNFLNPSTTSVTVAANTLTAGDSFSYELDFSNRDLVPSPGAVFDAQLGFDRRTDATFTTAPAAVPEPSTLALLGVGSLAARIAKRRRERS
jgi:hypothetical protein